MHIFETFVSLRCVNTPNKFFFSSLLFSSLSCQRSQVTLDCEFIINHERIAEIDKVSNIFHNELGEALITSKAQGNKFSIENLSERVFSNYQKALDSLGYTSLSYKEGFPSKSNGEVYDLTPYMEDAAIRVIDSFLVIDEEEGDMYDVLDAVDFSIDLLFNDIIANEEISNSEKQYIIESIRIKQNYLETMIIYSDDFEQLFGVDVAKCNWFCRKREFLRCAAWTALTTGTCVGVTTLMIAAGQLPLAVVAGSLCATYFHITMKCWSNYRRL